MTARRKASAPRNNPEGKKSAFQDATERVARGWEAFRASRSEIEIKAVVEGWEAKIVDHSVKTFADALAAIDYVQATFYGTAQTRHSLEGARKVIKREIERAEGRK